MNKKDFEKRIAHLTQAEIQTGAINAVTGFLVDKGIASEEELRQYFIEWMESRPASRKRPLKKSGKNKRSEL